MRRPLFGGEVTPEADVRPTLLGVVTLLFLLLFFLLSTSSGQRLGTITLALGSTSDLAPLPHSGLLHELRVGVSPTAVEITAAVSTTDISASATSTEQRSWSLSPTDLAAIDAVIVELHQLDPAQQQVTVTPTDDVSTELLVSVLDVVRGPHQAERFPSVALTTESP